MMRRYCSLLLAASLSMLPALAQEVQAVQAKDSTSAFPGLPLMPAGSVVKGIIVPRYESGKVSSLIKIAELKVESSSLLSVKGFAASLYDQSGNITKIVTPLAYMNFETAFVNSQGQISMDDPRFTARGQQLHLDTQKKVGVLRGPIRTSIPAAQNYSHR